MLSLIAVSWTTESGLPVLDKVDLSIARGEFVCIVGPSGSGKTSLLRLVADLQVPTSGEIGITPAGGVDRRLSYVFQNPVLLPWLTVRQNIELAFSASGQLIPRHRIDESLELIGLTEFSQYLPRQLSGGMQARVAIARALVNEPSLLLMDEPFSSLDEITREHMNTELQRILAFRPATVVFVTHDLAEAAFLADRVVVLTHRPGRVFEDIAIPFVRPRNSELLDSPAFDRVLSQLRHSLRAAAH